MASATACVELKCLGRGRIPPRGVSYSAPAPLIQRTTLLFFFFLPPKSQLQNSAVQIPLPPREATVRPRGQSEHQPERGSGRKSQGKNVHSSACEVCAFFSKASPPGPAARYLFSIFCICRLSDVKLARRSVTSSTCQKNTAGHQARTKNPTQQGLWISRNARAEPLVPQSCRTSVLTLKQVLI